MGVMVRDGEMTNLLKKTKTDILQEKMWLREFIPGIVFYRYEVERHTFSTRLVCRECYTLDETKEGYWTVCDFKIKWIPKNTQHQKKVFCRPTKERALQDFICRTKRRIEILESQINSSKLALDMARELKIND